MSEWNYSIVLVIPAADQVAGNQIAEALGYGPDTFSLPAVSEGATEPTHYFNHSFGAQAFVDMVQALGEGNPPEGMPPELLEPLSRMIISIRDGGDPVQHVDEALEENGLVRM